MGVLYATVSVPAAEPLLGRPAIEGIAPFLVRTGPRTICMEVPFDSIRTAIGPSITRPDWDDGVSGLGYSSNHPPDRPTSV